MPPYSPSNARLVVMSNEVVLVELADQVEQQLTAGLAERQIAELVDDDEIVAQQVLGQASAAAGGFLLLELIYQIDEVEEPTASPGADDR